jgi:hypothetical protein
MPGVPAVGVAAAMALALGAACAAQAPRVTEFVGRAFAHGVPYEEAIQLRSPAAQDQLSAILESNEQGRLWANAATMLGMVGDAKAGQTLMFFVTRGDDKLDPSRYDGKTAAIFALGYILNRAPDDKPVLDFLKLGLNPENWSSRIKWTSPFTDNPQRRNLQLSLASMRALGVSGTNEAQALLRAVPEQAKAADARSQEAIQSAVRDALRTNAAVKTMGLGRFLNRQQNRD